MGKLNIILHLFKVFRLDNLFGPSFKNINVLKFRIYNRIRRIAISFH